MNVSLAIDPFINPFYSLLPYRLTLNMHRFPFTERQINHVNLVVYVLILFQW